MKKLIDNLKNINVITKSGQINKQASRILRTHKHIYENLLNITSFLGKNEKDRVRIYCIINEIYERPKCITCGKPLSFIKGRGKFGKFCPNKKGKSCANKNEEVVLKHKETCMKKYGVYNPQQNTDVRKKTLSTMRNRYGGNAPATDIQILQKIKKSYSERTEEERDITRNKTTKTNIKKYGRKTYAESTMDEISYNCINSKEWLIENYIYKNKSMKQIAEELSISRGSVYKKLKAFGINKKTHKVLLEVDGIAFPLHKPNILKNKKWLQEIYINRNISKTIIGRFLNVNPSYIHRWCVFHNIEKNTEITNYSISAAEQDIQEYVKSITSSRVLLNRKNIIAPYELDMYIPEHKLAIEYCGIYWHSEQKGKDKNYHLRKLNLCHENDIHLIQIWENEWKEKPELVKSRIASLFNKNNKIYARKCTISEITPKKAKQFYECYHIQGFCGGSTHIGLFNENTLVAAMTFGKSRYNKNIEYELIRYSSILNTNIIGGASKLFKFFIKKYSPTSIISYSDKRWNKGNLYIQLQFKKENESLPNYFYFKINSNTKLYSRIRFQKHKLYSVLEKYDKNVTEYQNMLNNGYDRIWDCGNDIFIWKS